MATRREYAEYEEDEYEDDDEYEPDEVGEGDDSENPSENYDYVDERHPAHVVRPMLNYLERRREEIADALHHQLLRDMATNPGLIRSIITEDLDGGVVPDWQHNPENQSMRRAEDASRAEFARNKETQDAKKEEERKAKAVEMRHTDEVKKLQNRINALEAQIERINIPAAAVAAVSGAMTRGKRSRIAKELSTSKKAATTTTKTEEKPNSNNNEPDICCICLDKFENTERGCVQPCGHSRYHYDCAAKLYVKTGNCALHYPAEKISSVIKIFV